ncbi:nose resistant to fluoxetine protein 6-like isoform X1 [Amphiura filiformis]|uniref:nose resistant to fluoxetine protein 6-like isoform X1 n=1 Tax=Amphiura filiformis TaxID=82378 RepID=UPI003B217BD1
MAVVLSVLLLFCFCFGFHVDDVTGTSGHTAGVFSWYNKFSMMNIDELNGLETGIRNAIKDNLMSELMSFPETGIVSTVSPGCIKDTANFPIQALDAFGKPRSGILRENFAWLGNFHECTSLGTYQHCVADMQINAPMNNGTTNLTVPISWGICMPKSCSEDDIEILIKQVDVPFFHLIRKSTGRSDKTPGVVHCNQIPAKSYDAGFICVVTLSSILGFLMLLGAAVDVYIRWFESPQNINGYQTVDSSPGTVDTKSERTPLLKGGTPNDSVHVEVQRHHQTPKKQGFLTRFLLCFAVNRSLDKLLNAKQGDKSVGCLNGIRVLSISWVILAHSLLYPLNERMYDDTIEFYAMIRRLDFTVVVKAEYAVDTFFLLSGCLLTYLTLGKMAHTNGKLPWGLFYFHRFWRLTPVYSAVILFIIFLDPYIGSGPLWYRYIDHPNCEKYWWRNLLYISNFFPKSEMCMDWSWYLPNDMQFYVISPFILILLHKAPKVGTGLLATLTAISIIIRASLTAKYGMGSGIFGGGGVAGAYWDKIYDKPWTRISPYFVGMAVGFIMVRRPHLRMRPIVVLCGWVLASAVGLVVIYVVNNAFYRDWSLAEQGIYNGLGSFTWASCVGWVILACKNGYGGWINTFLSWNFWVPVGKLTYTVYLVHPIILRNILFSSSNPFSFTIIPISTRFTGGIVLSHMVAFVFALAIEFPFANLEKLLIPSNVEKKSEKERNKEQA